MNDDYPATDAEGGSSDRPMHAADCTVTRRDVLRTTGAAAAVTGLGLGSVGTASAAEQGIPTPWLEVEGNKVVDPLGNEVILRGVNIPDPKRLDHTVPARGKNWNHLVDLATNHDRGWYANVIRIPVHPWDVAELPPKPVAEGMESPPAEFNEGGYYEPPIFEESELVEYCETYLDAVVEHCRQRNVYCIVDYHRHWGDGSLKWHDDDLDTEAKLFWNTVAPRYAEDSHVIFEVYNEPTQPAMYVDDWYNAKYAGIWRRWKKTAQPWVDTIREHAPDNLIVVGSPGWSAMPEGAQIEEFDGENLMYSYHIYGGHGITSEEGFDGRETEEGTNSVWEDVPLFMTEFGWQGDIQERWIRGTTDGFGSAVTEWADDRPIHWTAWCFDTTWLPAMWQRSFVDGDGPDDAVGDPYSGDIPELCPDPPCEWDLLGRDVGEYSQQAGEYVRETLERRRNDDLPQVDHDPTPPAAPADVTAANVDERSAELSWSAVAETGETPLSHYVVTVDGTEWLEATDTSAVVEDLLAGRSQELGVRAVDEYGNVSDPATVQVTTDSLSTSEAPSPPSTLTLSDRTHRSVTLSWSGASASGEADIARYVVTFQGEEIARLRSDETTYRVDGLDLDTQHEVTVTAVDRTGQASEPLAATVKPRPAHATESDVLINDYESGGLTNNSLGGWVGGGLVDGVENGAARISWDGIDYHGTTVDVDATDTPFLKIRARGEMGYELSSLALRVDGSDEKQPVGDLTDDRISTEWSVVTIDLETAGADLSQPGQLQFDSVWGTAGSFEIDELWLTGADDPADGIEVDDTSEPTAPASPADLRTDAVATATAELSWEPVSDATGYLVSLDGEQVADTPEATATVTDLEPATTYELGVRAYNSAGQSPVVTTTVTTDEDQTGSELDPVEGTVPQDIDGDGTHEDFNANGELDSDDVVTFFNNYDAETVTNNADAYDFNDSGDVDFDDIVRLFRRL